MYLKQLQVHDFRNILSADLNFSRDINVIIGPNGSGKTSLLESIYYLSHGRSFRTSQVRSVVNHQETKFTLFAKLTDDTLVDNKLGFEKTINGEKRIVLNGQSIQSLAKLAKVIPVQVLNQDSFDLIDAGPRHRRKFIDWGVFHVEHGFSVVWQKFVHVLKQRNAALKLPKADQDSLSFWTDQFCQMASEVHQYRTQYLEHFQEVARELLDALMPEHDIHFEYIPGWDQNSTLSELMEANFESDLRQGISRLGPHRADLKILTRDRLVSEVLSRGQQKLLVYLLRLAQSKHLLAETEKTTVFLIDDLASEFDELHRAKIMQTLQQVQAQIFISAIDERSCNDDYQELIDVAMFHVEHGTVKKMV